MKGERIANAMNAALALERMRDGDSITVVSFDTAAQVVVPPTRISGGNRSSIEAAIRSIRLGGDTCISCGLEEGMKQLVPTYARRRRLNRMILLSDGATNAGVRDVRTAGRWRTRMHGGVTISTIGVDVDFDEKVMAAIARGATDGTTSSPTRAGSPRCLVEFDDLLASVAKETEQRSSSRPVSRSPRYSTGASAARGTSAMFRSARSARSKRRRCW